EDIKQHAKAASRYESEARIDAEIDLALSRMGLLDIGPAREEILGEMPPELAAKGRARLAHHSAIGFRSDAVVANASCVRPRELTTPTLATSDVLPDAPQHVRPYGKEDRAVVMELRVELEAIKEIDSRVALRDQPGTANGSDIARGETRRRAQHVARV